LIAPDSAVTIGVAEGSLDLQFHRIVSVEFVQGGILVADGGSNEIRRFSNRGEILHRWGGSGDGPGEFRRLRWATSIADTVYAWDESSRRLTVYDEAGNVAHVVRPTFFGGSAPQRVVGMFADHTLIVNPLEISSQPRIGAGVRAGDSPIAVAGWDDAALRPFTTVPGRPIYASSDGIRVPIPFTTYPAYSVAASSLIIGNGATHEFTRYSESGAALRTTRFVPERVVTAADLARYIDAYLESRRDGDASDIERAAKEAPVPEFMPTFDELAAQRSGATWIRTFTLPWDTVAEWVLLDSTGVASARLRTQPQFIIADATAESVVGIVRDSLGVEYIEVLWYSQ
jgi:hypothetical protein